MTDNTETEPIQLDRKKNRLPALIGGLVIGGSLAAMGGLFVYALLALGYAKAVDSDRWHETPCTILKSAVITERATPHSPGLSHELDIAYQYEFNGTTHESTQYRRMATRSAHQSKIEAIVQRFPARSKAVCYVNPQNPAESILKKDTKAVGYTVWFPGLFVVGGVGIMIASIRRALRKA